MLSRSINNNLSTVKNDDDDADNKNNNGEGTAHKYIGANHVDSLFVFFLLLLLRFAVFLLNDFLIRRVVIHIINRRNLIIEEFKR